MNSFESDDKLLKDYFKYLSDFDGLEIKKGIEKWRLMRGTDIIAESEDIIELFKFIHPSDGRRRE